MKTIGDLRRAIANFPDDLELDLAVGTEMDNWEGIDITLNHYHPNKVELTVELAPYYDVIYEKGVIDDNATTEKK